MADDLYVLRLDWGYRGADAADVADRFCKTIDELSTIFPTHRNWIWADCNEMLETDGESGTAPLATVRRDMPRAIEKNVFIDEGYDAPFPGNGFQLAAMTDPTNLAKNMSYFGTIGWMCYPSSRFVNNVKLSTGDASIVSYASFRAALLLLAEAWEATFAINKPHDMPARKVFHSSIAWMTYVSPRLARTIIVPDAIIVERRDNGGLFMAATRDVFDVSNADHMAAARRIEEATIHVFEEGFDQSIPYY